MITLLENERDFFYRIENFFPKLESDMNRQGFHIYLNRKVAARLLEIKMPESNRMQEIGREILNDLNMKYPEPYSFWEDTVLLQFMKVGVHTDFGAMGTDMAMLEKGKLLNTSLQFSPHNVDTCVQAIAFMALWIRWAELMTSIFLRDN